MKKSSQFPFGDPTYNGYRDIKDLPQHVIEEMAHFFTVYKELEHKKTAVLEIVDCSMAENIIEKCLESYQEKFGK